MKKLLLALLLSACATSTLTPLQTAGQIATAVIAGEQTYAAAKNGTLTTAQVAADLNGVAALSQAYVGTGKTPTQAALQTGASTATALASVVAALPNAPISQASTNTLWQAAAIVAAQAPTQQAP